MKKWYLVPTDFSAAARNAALYAMNLAQQSRHGVHFFYAFQPDLDVQSPFLYDSMAKLQEMWMEKLETWSNEILAEHGRMNRDDIRNEVSIGFAAEEIIRLSQEDENCMIIMGAKGEGGMVGTWLGTVSAKVAQEAYCPVWLVPVDARIKPMRNILYASSGDAIAEEMIHQVVRFTRRMEATLHFVHIHNAQGAPEDKIIEKIFETLGAGAFGDLSYIVEMINGQDIIQELNEYVVRNEVDLVISVTHHKSFWEKLVKHSITKDLTIHASVPTLIVHKDDEQTLNAYIDTVPWPLVIS
ncbi:MAG: universal stress protein [Saprospiraceae bacterium]|nr:universal stress protein [Saprospiraceae bacterium]